MHSGLKIPPVREKAEDQGPHLGWQGRHGTLDRLVCIHSYSLSTKIASGLLEIRGLIEGFFFDIEG